MKCTLSNRYQVPSCSLCFLNGVQGFDFSEPGFQAVVFKEEGFLNLAVPVPSTIQVCYYPFLILYPYTTGVFHF